MFGLHSFQVEGFSCTVMTVADKIKLHIQGGVCSSALLGMPYAGMSVVVLFSLDSSWYSKLQLHSFCKLLELSLKVFDSGTTQV
jgi:hypothetical protein